MQFSFLVTIALALVFLALEIEKQLARAGRFDMPIVRQVILASYTILMPNFFLTVWASSKNKVIIHSKDSSLSTSLCEGFFSIIVKVNLSWIHLMR